MMMDQSIKAGIFAAVAKALEKTGLDAFKKTSFFARNQQAESEDKMAA
ncbi:hypothetical protein [Parvibaculum sp.]